MNTFGSDLNKILSAREQVHAVGGALTDVPVIKADTIKKAEQKETDQNDCRNGEYRCNKEYIFHD